MTLFYFVYILISKKDRKLYVGYTTDLNRRLQQHRSGKVKSTAGRRPLKIIYYEVYFNKKDAEKREKYLKGGNGRAQLKIQLIETLKNNFYKYL